MLDNCLTKTVKLRSSRQYLISKSMKEETIAVRELLRNYKKYAAQNKVFIIQNHGKPEKVLVPYVDWEKKEKTKGLIITRELIEKYSSPSGIKDLSSQIDDILYGPWAN